MCANWTSREPAIASDICLSMGFSHYKNFLQTFINSRLLDVRVKGISNSVSARNATDNETCLALYVKCSTEHLHLTWQKIQRFEQQQDIDVSISPWNAAIYINGSYKCVGILLSSDLVLISFTSFGNIR